MQDRYGVCLLHRHFDLQETEQVVEYGGVATPWPTNCPLPTDSQLHPTVWKISGGMLEPYEFQFIPAAATQEESLQHPVNEGFVRVLYGFLKENDLLDVFGLARLSCSPSKMPMIPCFEANIGRVSLTFPVDDTVTGVGAMWCFESQGKGICVRVCSQCRDFGTC